MRNSVVALSMFLLVGPVAHAANPIKVVIPAGLKAVTTGKPPPSHDLPSLTQAVKLSPQFVAAYADGAKALVKSVFTRKFGGFDRALATSTKLSDERIRKMPADVHAELAGVLLDGKLMANGATKASANKQFLRVLTGRGRDAGHVLGTLSRLGLFTEESVTKKLEPAAAAEFKALMTEIASKPGDWGSFREFAQNATGAVARQGNGVELLVNGSTYFPELKAALDGAKKYALMEMFAIHSDATGADVMGQVADAAKRNVYTQVAYDGVGSMASERSVFAAPKEAGTKVSRTPAPRPLGGSMDHRKLVVVDGVVGFDGGMNLGTEYKDVWHDVQTKLTGPIVADLTKIITDEHKANGGKLTRGMRKTIRVANEKALATEAGDVTALAVNHVGLKDQNQKLLYLQATRLAKKNIWIENPYLTDDDMVTELAAAAKRGVDVRVILPARNDEKLLAWGERARFTALLGAGVKVYQYVGKDLNSPQMAHGKVAVFDDDLATVGSSNLDQRSLKNNHETNIWAEGRGLSDQLKAQVFEKDFQTSKQVVQYTPGELDKLEDALLRRQSKAL